MPIKHINTNLYHYMVIRNNSMQMLPHENFSFTQFTNCDVIIFHYSLQLHLTLCIIHYVIRHFTSNHQELCYINSKVLFLSIHTKSSTVRLMLQKLQYSLCMKSISSELF